MQEMQSPKFLVYKNLDRRYESSYSIKQLEAGFVEFLHLSQFWDLRWRRHQKTVHFLSESLDIGEQMPFRLLVIRCILNSTFIDFWASPFSPVNILSQLNFSHKFLIWHNNDKFFSVFLCRGQNVSNVTQKCYSLWKSMCFKHWKASASFNFIFQHSFADRKAAKKIAEWWTPPNYCLREGSN